MNNTMSKQSKVQNDLTTEEKQEKVKNELASFYMSVTSFDEVTASESDDEEGPESLATPLQEEQPAEPTRRNVMIKQTDVSRRKRPGALHNKKSSSAWASALSSNRTPRHIDHSGAVSGGGNSSSSSATKPPRNSSSTGMTKLDSVVEEDAEEDEDDEVSITIIEEDLADEPSVRRAPPRRSKSSDLVDSVHSHGSASSGPSSRVPPRRSRSGEISRATSPGKLPLRRGRSGDATSSDFGLDRSQRRARRRPSRSEEGDSKNNINYNNSTSSNDMTLEEGHNSNSSNSAGAGRRRRATRRGRRGDSNYKSDEEGTTEDDLDDDEDDGSIISNPDSGMAALKNAVSGNAGAMSALDKLKAAAKVAATADEIPSSSNRGSSRDESRRGSGSARMKSVANGLLFISKTKALSEERRRNGGTSSSRRRPGGGGDRDKERERRREGSGGGSGRRSPLRGDDSERRRHGGSDNTTRKNSPSRDRDGDSRRRDSHDNNRRSESDRRRGDHHRGGDHRRGGGDGEQRRRGGDGRSGSSSSRPTSSSSSNSQNSPTADDGSVRSSGGSSRRRSRTVLRKNSGDLDDEFDRSSRDKRPAAEDSAAAAATSSSSSKPSSADEGAGQSSSSKPRGRSRWAGVKGSFDFINKSKSLSKSNHRSRSLEREKKSNDHEQGNSGSGALDSKLQLSEPGSPQRGGLTRSNSDGSINIASLGASHLPANSSDSNGMVTMDSMKDNNKSSGEIKKPASALFKKMLAKKSKDVALKSILPSANETDKENSTTATPITTNAITSSMNGSTGNFNGGGSESKLKGLLSKAIEDTANEKKKSSKWTALKGGVDFANRLMVKAGTGKSSSSSNGTSSSSDTKKSDSGAGESGSNKKKSGWGLASKLAGKKKVEQEEMMDYGLMMSVASFSEDAMEGLRDFAPETDTIQEGDEEESDFDEDDEEELDDDVEEPEEQSEGNTNSDGSSGQAPSGGDMQTGSALPNADALFDLMGGGESPQKQAADAFDMLGVGHSPEKKQGGAFDLLGRGSSSPPDEDQDAFNLLGGGGTSTSQPPDAFAVFGGNTAAPGIKAVDRRQMFSKLAEPSLRFDFDRTNETVTNLSHPETIEEGDEDDDEDEGARTIGARDNLKGLAAMAMQKGPSGQRLSGRANMKNLMAAIEEEEEESDDDNDAAKPAGGIVINTRKKSKWNAVKGSILFTSKLNASIADRKRERENSKKSNRSSPAVPDEEPSVDFGLMMSMEGFSADAMEGLEDMDFPDEDDFDSDNAGSAETGVETDKGSEAKVIVEAVDSHNENHAGIQSEPHKAGAAGPRVVTPEKTSHDITDVEDEEEVAEDDYDSEDDFMKRPLKVVQLCIVPGRKMGDKLPMAVHSLEEQARDGVRRMSVSGKQRNEKDIIRSGLFRLAIPEEQKTKPGTKKKGASPRIIHKKKGPEQVFGWVRTPSTRNLVAEPVVSKSREEEQKLVRSPAIIEEEEEEEEVEEPRIEAKTAPGPERKTDPSKMQAEYDILCRALAESRARTSAAKTAVQRLQQEIQKQRVRYAEVEGLRQAALHDLERKNVQVQRR